MIDRVQTWADVATGEAEIAWAQWAIESVAAANEAAIAAGVEREAALGMVADVYCAACVAFGPRPELREQVLEDLAWAFKAAWEEAPN